MSDYSISERPNRSFATDFNGEYPIVDDDADLCERASSIAIREPSFLQVIWAWEKLRVVYNAMMLIVFVLLAARMALDTGVVPRGESFWYFGLVYVAVVNVPFCFCHAVEIYLCFLRLPRWLARSAIFMAITILMGGPLAALVCMK